MTPAPNQLWNLGGALFELLEAREEAANDLERARQFQTGNDLDGEQIQQMAVELAAIEHGITQFVAQQLRDVDGLRAPLKALEQGVAINKADAAAATNRAMVLQNRYDKLKDLIRSCMIALDQAGEWKPKESRKFESARGSFLLRNNGGVAPVEITNESLIPDEYCRVTLTISCDIFAMLDERFTQDPRVRVGPREVSKSAVAEALQKPCVKCKGTGMVCSRCHGFDDYCADVAICESCHGERIGSKFQEQCPECDGTKTCGVPGARLADRGVSVVIK